MASLGQYVDRATSKVKDFFIKPTPQGQTSPGKTEEEIPTSIKGAISGWGQPMNLSTVTTDITKIQAAIRQAERGDCYQIFALYRDFTLGCSHLQAEFGKRKMVVMGQPVSIQPQDKKNAADVKACEAIKQMIEECDNWDTGLGHLMDAALWPVAICEKIFEPWTSRPESKIQLRYRLKKFAPVNPTLISYRAPFMATSAYTLPGTPLNPAPIGPNGFPLPPQMTAPIVPTINNYVAWNPDDWEADLRFYSVLANGNVNRSLADLYPPEHSRHIVHRGTLLNGIPDYFGAAFRSTMFWIFLGVQGRDWWSRFMERYGSPFIVGKANMQNVDTVNFLERAINNATKIGGIVINKDASLELEKCDTAGAAEGFKMFFDLCNDEISKIVVGQTTSSNQHRGGGIDGGGTASVHETVRQDIRQFDQKALGNTLKRQLFRQFLDINGIPGAAPNIVWGGLDEDDAANFAKMLQTIKSAGLTIKEDSMETVSEKLGLNVEVAPEPEPVLNNGGNGSKTKSRD